jgi:tellurium resistance protein TerD
MSDLDKLDTVDYKDQKPLTDDDLKKRIGAKTIAKGEDVHLSQLDYALKILQLGVGWDIPGIDPAGIDVDFSLFLLDKNDMTVEDTDFVFYNNLTDASKAVEHLGDNQTGMGDGDDERVVIKLTELSYNVMKIVLVFSIHDFDMRDQSLMMLRNPFVRLVNKETDIEILRYVITDTFDKKDSGAVIVGEFVREGPVWIFKALCEQVEEGGLGKIATKYGMMITG